MYFIKFKDSPWIGFEDFGWFLANLNARIDHSEILGCERPIGYSRMETCGNRN